MAIDSFENQEVFPSENYKTFKKNTEVKSEDFSISFF